MPPAALAQDAPCPAARTLVAGAPDGWDATVLAGLAREAGVLPLLHVAESRRRLEVLRGALAFFAPDVEVLPLPAWDCRPYDRISPSVGVMARRMATLRTLALGCGDRPRILLTTAAGLLRRAPPPELVAEAVLPLRLGCDIDPETLHDDLVRLGYTPLPEADEPGEALVTGTELTLLRALDGAVVRAAFPSGRTLDSLTLDGEPVEDLALDAASELLLDQPAARRFEAAYDRLAGGAAERDPLLDAVRHLRRHTGVEHWLPLFNERMASLFDLLPDSPVSLDERAAQVRDFRLAEIREAHRRRLGRRELEAKAHLPPYHPVPLEAAFLDEAAWDVGLSARPVTDLDDDPPEGGGAADAGGRRRGDWPDPADIPAIAARVEGWRAEGRRVVVAVDRAAEAPVLAKLIARRKLGEARPVTDWQAAQALPAGTIAVAPLPLDQGFTAPGLVVVARGDLVQGGTAHQGGPAVAEPPPLSLGGLVVHPEHGVGLAEGLEPVDAAGAPHDCLRLVYKDGDTLFVPVESLDSLHPYGLTRDGISLDKLGGAAWATRMAKARAAADDIAGTLLSTAARRAAAKQPPVTPPRRAWRAFLSGFPYVATPDQARAIDDVLADLGAGRTMDRLVVGDVGVGKTEVALRAAFAVAMAGRQVAVVAPTSPLARQHLEDFSDRLAGFPVEVGFLGRGQSAAEAKAVKAGLAAGSLRVVVGTHALLARGVTFKDLGLVVLDEEHRFGVRQKQRLTELSATAHTLAMSATPIPRTLRLALSGIRDVSVIATPPSSRRAVRTEAGPLTDALMRDALRRERARGGQSFVIAPRIDDLDELRRRLEAAVPELSVAEAHGKLKPEELEDRVTRFVEGGADVLLATNIVETGLDIPNANTIIVHRARRFGLAQLHQLRGRVGRSRVQAHAHLTWPEDRPPNPAGLERLQTLVALTGPGAGWAVAERDMEMRGGGDLLGEAQAGHVKDVGSSLFQALLREAVAEAKGEPAAESWSPRIALDRAALIPADYVPDTARRFALYARVAHLEAPEQRQGLEAELRRAHGPPPPEAETLLDVAELKLLCRRAGVEALEIGPKGALLTPRPGTPALLGTEPRADGKLRLPFMEGQDRMEAVRAALGG